MPSRSYTPVRIGENGLKRADEIAEARFEGNRSAAIRYLLQLGLAAWHAGAHSPEQVAKAAPVLAGRTRN